MQGVIPIDDKDKFVDVVSHVCKDYPLHRVWAWLAGEFEDKFLSKLWYYFTEGASGRMHNLMSVHVEKCLEKSLDELDEYLKSNLHLKDAYEEYVKLKLKPKGEEKPTQKQK